MESTGQRFDPAATDMEPTFQRKIYQEHVNRYQFASRFVTGKRVLDLGCGVGYGSQWLGRKGPEAVVGLDIAEDAVAHGGRHYGAPGISFVVGDAMQVPFEDRSFDVVVCFELIEHVERCGALLSEARRILKKDGLFIVSTPRRKGPPRSPFQVHEFTFNDYRQLLEMNFERVKFFFQNSVVGSVIAGHRDWTGAFEEAINIGSLPEAGSDNFIGVCGGMDTYPEAVAVFNDDSYIFSLERDLTVLRGDVSRSARAAEEDREELAALEGQVARLETEIARLHGSTAFRLRELWGSVEGALLPLRAWRLLRQFGWRLFLRQTAKYLTRSSTRMWIEMPSPGAGVTQPFLLRGWAIDTAARVGTGVDAVQVWAHPTGELDVAPIFLGRATYGGVRPYVGEAFGAQFADSGYDLAIAGLRPGPCRIVVEAHSSVSNSFNNSWATTVSVAEQETTREFRKHLPDPKRFKVLFLVGCVEGENKRYRVHNVQEQLAQLGVETATTHEIDITGRLDWVLTFDVMVLMRAAISPMIRSLIRLCRRLDIPTVFEIDDYLFEPEIIPYVDGMRRRSEADKKYFEDSVRGIRETLELCDYFVAPTDYLAARAGELGKRSFVIRNGVNERQLQVSQKALRTQKKRKGVVRIGYLSGTPTHQKDFEVAVPALLRILGEFPQVELSIQGYLDLGERFEEFRDRVEQRPFVGWEELPFHIASLDINIAPLEIGNPFCEAKSELKYFEPALLKVPTVASATEAFRFAITSGENGFLAETDTDWYLHLKELVEKPELRGEMGERAYRQVTSTYTPRQQAQNTFAVCQEILRDYRKRLGFQEESLSISWIVPTPFAGSGGHRNIFRAVKYLSQFGHSARMYFPEEGGFGTSSQLGAFLDSSFFPIGAEIILGVEDISPCDALIATHWTTAYAVRANREKAKRVFYFVQDFEPYFHPMGDDYIRAENTYRMGFTCITSGPWCAKLLKERYGAKADHFRFPLDINVYYPRNVSKPESKRVVFFARPDMPRRCYPLGVEALIVFHERNPEVEICLFGSDNVDSAVIPFPHRNVGLVPTLDDLAELYSTATVGVAFSTTNPSLVPFEMMACGCPVVDLDYGDNYVNYGSRDNVMLVEPTAEGIAEGIELLIRNEELRLKIARNGFDFARSLPNEQEVGRRIESLILKEFQEKSPLDK